MMYSSEVNGETVVPATDSAPQVTSFPIQEDHQFQVSEGGADKRKKVQRIFGWGLRRFSTIVCEKVEAKGRTSYNEVSDEILADVKHLGSGSQQIEFDEKNLRRRIYDAFNVLDSIGVIARDKKEVWWLGFPHAKSEYLKRLQKHRKELLSRIQKKADFLQEIEDQYLDLRNLAFRNQKSGLTGISSGVALPFLLIKTSPMATVEVDISDDSRLVHFEFNGTPFTMHDDASVLKAMRFKAEGRTQKVNQIILDGSHSEPPLMNNAT